MFDLGWAELLVIGVVALIVVGPKDLPGMFRTMGRFTGKMRRMAREFSKAMEDAADQTGVKDVTKDLKGMTNPKKMGLDKLNEAAERFDKWEPGQTLAKSKAKAKAEDVGPETARLKEDRAEKAQQVREASAAKTAERRAAAAVDADDVDPGMVDDTYAPADDPEMVEGDEAAEDTRT